jgi:hypothetical protein
MPKISMSIPQSIGQAEATQRLQTAFSDAKVQYAGQFSDLKEEWNGSTGNVSLKAGGFNVSAQVQITDTAVDVVADVPMMLLPFKGQIEQMVKERAATLLA